MDCVIQGEQLRAQNCFQVRSLIARGVSVPIRNVLIILVPHLINHRFCYRYAFPMEISNGRLNKAETYLFYGGNFVQHLQEILKTLSTLFPPPYPAKRRRHASAGDDARVVPGKFELCNRKRKT